MHQGYKNARGLLMSNPLFSNPHLNKIAKQALKYSVGIEIEIECDPQIRNYFYHLLVNKEIMHYTVGFSEVNFRITPGIEGLQSLKKICLFLQANAPINMKSGIHYHIDCSEITDWFKFYYFVTKSWNKFILVELSAWGYTGDYNKKIISCDQKKSWVNFRRNYKTIEFRIGEMTFDYELMCKRIFHLQSIVHTLKEDYNKLLLIK